MRLPEFHVTCAENETTRDRATRYGRKVEHIIDLNRERMEALDCGDDEQLQPTSALPIGTTLLPAQAHEERPRAISDSRPIRRRLRCSLQRWLLVARPFRSARGLGWPHRMKRGWPQ